MSLARRFLGTEHPVYCAARPPPAGRVPDALSHCDARRHLLLVGTGGAELGGGEAGARMLPARSAAARGDRRAALRRTAAFIKVWKHFSKSGIF